jgi:hypothetical protein
LAKNFWEQGDQIGRIFAHLDVYNISGQFDGNDKNSPEVWSIFFTENVALLNLPKYGLGYILGDFFQKNIWSPCLGVILSIRWNRSTC